MAGDTGRLQVVDEVAEKREPYRLTFFRVKLSGETVAAADGADKSGSVMGGSPGKGRIFWNHTEAVVEIELIVLPVETF